MVHPWLIIVAVRYIPNHLLRFLTIIVEIVVIASAVEVILIVVIAIVIPPLVEVSDPRRQIVVVVKGLKDFRTVPDLVVRLQTIQA